MIFSLAGMVSVAKLLSTCIDANRQGCEVIREFYEKSSAAVSGSLKDADDVRSVVTQADIDAQAKIVGGLRATWGPDLKIIGEEDIDCNNHNIDALQKVLRTDLLQNAQTDVNEKEVPLKELAVFVDPLDGTREFVEGRVENVACLVGIARNGRSFAGVVGLPFPNGKKTTVDEDVVMHYALLRNNGNVVGKWPLQQPENGDNEQQSTSKGMTVLTGDSSNPILAEATKRAMLLASENTKESPNHSILGGTAAKLLSISDRQNSIAILHFLTSLWDTCATEALITAKGGQLTDLFGYPLIHHESKPETGNILGVVASSGEPETQRVHNELCAQMRGDTAAVRSIFGKYMGQYRGEASIAPQALDIARDLDGAPLQRSWLEQHVGGAENAVPLVGYCCPESNAWRGLMSNGCRILLDWEKAHGDKESSSLPLSVFFKRIDMSESPDSRAKLQNAPHKLVRDVRSYQVETGFLTSDACQEGLIPEGGVLVSRVYGADLRPAQKGSPLEAQIQSRFAMLVQDFRKEEGWQQEWLLQENSAKAALDAFAKMHGYFWHDSNFWRKDGGRPGRQLENIVWTNGGYMQPALQGLDQLDNVDAGWSARLPTFERALREVPQLQNVDLSKLGERLQKVAAAIGAKAHPFSDGKAALDTQKYRTLIHGDPKQANIFFRKNKKRDEKLEVGLIDFQWCGFGLAATDIAHHVCAALEPACLSYCGSKEKELLDHYYECLGKALVQNGAASSLQDVQENVFPRKLLQSQYEIALLDICRMVFAYAWKRWQPESKPTLASLNRNAYNKSLPNVLWLITRCSELLTMDDMQNADTTRRISQK